MVVCYGQTPIPDANFEQFLVDQGMDTNGVNGNILNADAQAVTNLNVTRNDITDFTGLEAFVNIETLNLGTNQFATLPLNGLVALEELEFNQNVVLANLDLSTNTNLRRLDIRANGGTNTAPMATLDLSNNLLLEYVHIYNFRSLANVIFPDTDTVEYVYLLQTAAGINVDFSGYDSLETLNLSTNFSNALPINAVLPSNQNALKSASFQGGNIVNPDLSNFLALEYLSFQSSNVETLQLPVTNTLERIRITNHNIANINFVNASGLLDLEISNKNTPGPLNLDITNNPTLQRLDADGNNLTNLDITQNALLVSVNVSNNELPTLDTGQNVLLEFLNASRNNITSMDLAQNVVLEDLNLNTNELPTINLATNIALQSLNLGSNQLPNLDVTTNTALRTLNIGNNLFTGTGLDLTQNIDLVSFNAERNQIESLDITQNIDLQAIILNHNLFPGTAILDQFYAIRAANGGIRRGIFEVSHNLLSGKIPNFADLFLLGPGDTDPWTRRFQLTIDNNLFHFADLEDDHLDFIGYFNALGANNTPILSTYNYAPQAKVNAIETPTRNAGESITLTTTVRGTQNHYTWFKDGVPIPDAPDSPELILTDLNTCDAGVYYAEVTSDLAPFENGDPPATNGKNLLLVRNDITLTVNATRECVTLDMPLTNVPINAGVQWNDIEGACGYRISLGTNPGATDLLPLTDVGEVTVYNHTADFAPNQDIFVTIVPYYVDGDFTSGCTELTFSTSANAVAPQCTFISFPTDGETNIAADLSRIDWNPANGADEYSVTVSSPSGANDVTTTTTETFLPLSNDFNAEEIVTISIVPENDIGQATGCNAETFTIVVAAPDPPPCTTLSAPANGASGVAANLNEIVWDAVPNADGYRITINGSSNDTNNVSDLEVTGTSYTLPNDFAPGETVDVTVVPFNGDGEAVGCAAQSFTIANSGGNVPICTRLASPLGNATDVSSSLDLISWSGVPNATGYSITVEASESSLNNITDQVVNGISYPFNNSFVNGETVSVTVVPFNSEGNAQGCTTETFTIVDLPGTPECTSLTNPVNAATNVPLNTTISWNGVPNVQGYLISIQTEASETIVPETDLGNVTSFVLPRELPPNTQILIAVTPYNQSGESVSCTFSSIRTAGADTDAPSCTALNLPANGDTGVATDTELRWNAVGNVDGYLINMGTTEGGTDILDITDVGLTTSYRPATPLPADQEVFVTVVPYSDTDPAQNCGSQSFTTAPDLVPEDDATQYGISPNGDGINDFWVIDGIGSVADNTVSIYNRWGEMVFQVQGYDNRGNVFSGMANRKTKMGADVLPSGTYFFNIQASGTHNLKKTQGYLVIKR
ncbi:gliding motility-associated C-terminal domain-containing protein [Maribacter sp. 2307ULW6-5]|uniref:T9SS type B sorting domain-containing protein n=1 Tax=Maribacter sp. 2307ULW6-5 TaxID=3386275 RepID=UPI0039BC3A8E